MSTSAVELLKRAFAGFETIAKRDPKVPGAVEVDLGKVATEIAKAAATLGASGDVEALEATLEEFGTLLEKATYDSTTDKVYSAATEVAKRVAVSKEDGRYYVDHGSGPAKAPAPGSKEQKANQYTAEGGLANGKGQQYTETSNASFATTPSGAPAVGFDQPAGGPAAKAAKAKAQTPPPAKPTRTNAGAAQAEGETAAEPAISEGKQGRAKTAKSATRYTTTEDIWARDMAAMTVSEVEEVRKAAKSQAAGAGPEAEVDEVSNDKKARKAAKAKGMKPGCKSHDAGSAEGAEVDEIKAKKAKGPEGAVDDASDDEDETPSDAVDDRSSADAKRKKAAKQGGAEGGQAAGAEDVDTVEETEKASDDDEEYDGEDAADDDEDEEDDEKPFPPKKGKGKVEKSADEDVEWERDLSPAESPVKKSARTPVGQLGAKANSARAVEKRHGEIRKAALSVEQVPGDVLTPDQVAVLQKSARMTAAQRRRANAKRLKAQGYVPGSRELEVQGIDDATVASEE